MVHKFAHCKSILDNNTQRFVQHTVTTAAALQERASTPHGDDHGGHDRVISGVTPLPVITHHAKFIKP